jgi:predicted component of type VI protein secretion system
MQTRQISRWHFELRRFGDGYRVRPVSNASTEVDGELIQKDREVAIRPGSKIRVANSLTIAFPTSPGVGEPGSSDATMIAGDAHK